jgi:hypothetical protein
MAKMLGFLGMERTRFTPGGASAARVFTRKYFRIGAVVGVLRLSFGLFRQCPVAHRRRLIQGFVLFLGAKGSHGEEIVHHRVG